MDWTFIDLIRLQVFAPYDVLINELADIVKKKDDTNSSIKLSADVGMDMIESNVKSNIHGHRLRKHLFDILTIMRYSKVMLNTLPTANQKRNISLKGNTLVPNSSTEYTCDNEKYRIHL